jgi:tetratricopeptide (TPR) repeat protein
MQETVNVALNLPNVKQEAEPEKDRIIQHQLSLARQLMQNEKYAEAKVKVDLILEKLDPNNLEAKTFREEMLRVTNLIAQQKREKQQRLIEYQERIKNLIMLAGQSLDSKQYDEAKALYRQILGIDSDNSLAKESLARIEMLVAKNAADAAKTRSMQADLNESFTQGMVAYNAGNLTLAAKYLRDLIGHAENQHFNQARIAMDDIEEHLKVEIEEKLNDARAHFSNGRLLEARQLLQDILSADPKQQDARALNQQVLAESRERAQQIFREAYTYEHLVQDYNTAKDRYQKVLELLPETNEEYHQKAQARLKTLN